MAIVTAAEKQRRDLSFIRRKVRSAIPAQILSENENLENFINAVYDYMYRPDGLSTKIAALSSARDTDDTQFMSALKVDLAKDFPETNTLDDRTLLRVLYLFYLSKGSTEAVESYFKVFLNSPNIEVVYPKDNLLRTSDGTWDSDNSTFTTSRGFLSETTIVLQDSYYYQLYSYVIKSGISVNDWGSIFKPLVHPTGWEFFGEVELIGNAFFDVGVKSPTIQPCNIVPDARFLIVGSAVMNTPRASVTPRTHIITRSQSDLYNWSMNEYKHNILNASNITLADVNDLTFDDFENDIALDIRPGAILTQS